MNISSGRSTNTYRRKKNIYIYMLIYLIKSVLSGNPFLSTSREFRTHLSRLDRRHHQTFHYTIVYLQWSLKDSSTVSQREGAYTPPSFHFLLPRKQSEYPGQQRRARKKHSHYTFMLFLLSVKPGRGRKFRNRNLPLTTSFYLQDQTGSDGLGQKGQTFKIKVLILINPPKVMI